MSGVERVARVAQALRDREVDRLLVTAPVNLRYLTGFTGSSGLALIAASPAQRQLFFTDFRYETQSAEQVPAGFACEIAPADLLAAVVPVLAAESESAESHHPRRLGFDDASLTVREHARLREMLPAAWELSACGGVVERERELKDTGEVARIRAAAQLADEALRGVLEAGVVGRAERDVAIDLELSMRRLGAQGVSFPSIVACGEHGALPHAEPREEPIPRGVLLTIDWGALHDGYCSDCTRTFATGSLGDEEAEVYELVLRAQQAALSALCAGAGAREVDGVAREIIERAGHGEHFGHGVGHGVGMEVHEAPRLSRTAPEEPLRAGQVVTVEPGVYLPGRLGVRIEDLAVVTDTGHECLTTLPKELTTIS